jgi:ATP-dependent protease ClpP protease subunit
MSDEVIEPPVLKKIYAIFAGSIDQIATQRLGNAVSLATQQGVDEIHLLFQTSGGTIGDGVFLYNLFRSVHMDIILYNCGCVASIGVIAYLGADERITTSNATFMIHRAMFSPVMATVDRLQSATYAAALDDHRLESILHGSITLPKEKWDIHRVSDLWLSADEAVTANLADSIGEFAPPFREQIYYVGQT